MILVLLATSLLMNHTYKSVYLWNSVRYKYFVLREEEEFKKKKKKQRQILKK